MASNVENILQATIDGTTYEVPANSRVEELLIELKEVIEAGGGGGGGGTTNYNALSNKPKINSIELSGNKSLSDLSLYSKSEVDTALSAKANTTDVETALGNKVDKVSGKGLSSNDYTNAEKTKLSNIESEANKTVVDSTLSTTSTNPVQNKVINIALSGKQDTISDLENIRTGAGLGTTAVQPEAGKGLSSNDFTDSEKAQITTNKNGIAAAANRGSKNLLRNTIATQTVGGVKFTFNADGSITANGTKSNNDWLYLSTGNSLSAGTYVLSSGGVTGLDKLVVVSTADSLGSAIMTTNTNTGVYERTLTQDYTDLYYAIRIASGTVLNNVTFKPMLCTKAEWDISQEFVPYAPTNRELYEMILALQSGT